MSVTDGRTADMDIPQIYAALNYVARPKLLSEGWAKRVKSFFQVQPTTLGMVRD